MSGFGGGFDNDGGTPSKKPMRNYDEQTLIPVTIKMITSAQLDPNGQGELSLNDGRRLHMVKLVAAVRTHEDKSTNLLIDVEDGTGCTQVKVWVNEGDDCSAVTQLRQAASQDHTYIRIIGQVKEYDGMLQVVANDVRPVSTGNELTYHLLEVAHSYEKSLKMQNEVKPMGGGMGFGIGNMASNAAPPQMGGVGMGAQGGVGGGMGGGSALNDMVLNVVKDLGTGNDSGVHVNDIEAQVSSQGFSSADIKGAISYLQNEGHIYSTIDEQHVQYAE
mmetsp:Transcript_10277/g.21701  ORF Transcript_10277/g.21701 Transcript_10277/m.21701 type:complete len:275 (+) Transcript_10277:71-895(+)